MRLSRLVRKIKPKHLALPIASLLIVAGLLYYLGIENIAEAVRVIVIIKPGFFPLLLGLALLEMLVMASRIVYYMKIIEPEARTRDVLSSYIIGFPFVLGLPFRVVGLIVRAYVIKKKTNTWMGSSITSILVEKASNAVIGISLAVVGLLPLIGVLSGDISKSFYWLAPVFAVMIALLLWLFKSKKIESLSVRVFEKAAKVFGHDAEEIGERYLENVRKITGAKPIAVGLSMTIAMWVINFLRVYLIFLMFDAEIGYALIAGIVTLGYVIGVLSQTPGGLGAFELSTASLFIVTGVENSTAISAVLVERLFSYWLFIFIGLGLLLVNKTLIGAIGRDLVEKKPVQKIKEKARDIKEKRQEKKIERKTKKQEKKVIKKARKEEKKNLKKINARNK